MAKYTDKEMDRILSAGKKSYASMSNKGQPGGIASIPSSGKRSAFVNLQRQKFFDGRKDVPEERVFRRTGQEGTIRQFKDALERKGRVLKGTRPDGETYTVMNPNTGEPVYLTDVPGGRSVSDVTQDLAYRFGPTPREILGDVKYATASMARGLGEKVMSGQFGLLGIAKGLYDKFTESFSQKKQELGTKVNALSDIQKEKIANPQNHKLSISKDPELQDIIKTEQDQMTAFDQANLIRANMERLSTPLTEVDTAQSFKVMPEDQVSLQDIYMQGTKRYEPISVSGTQPMYAGGLESLLPQPIQNLQQRIGSLGQTPIGTFGLEDVTTGRPSLTYEKDVFGGTLGLKADPLRDQYGFEFSKAFKDGGSVDDKLDNMQKKTNNIYGTGILSAR